MIGKNIQSQLDELPNRTGVYKFYDQDGTVLYVGKALNLKSRVSSYFRDEHYDRPQIITMIPIIEKIEVIETENEIESLVLESALIKQYMPRFNILMKDDKSYAWIYVSTREKIPTVKIVHAVKKDEYRKGKLFGPYPQGLSVKRIYRYLRKLFPFCTCKPNQELCLYYHMGLCAGPHHGKISVEDYRKIINSLVNFLEGKKRNYIAELKREMVESSENMNFERAAILRDRISDLEYISQSMIASPFEKENDFKQKRSAVLNQNSNDLAEELGIQKAQRIECYDISNIGGTLAVGSMVVSINGIPESSQYRIFKIKGVEGSNDPLMLKEVLSRRVKHIGIGEEDSSLNSKPDIILIDGASTQLGAVKECIPEGVFLMGISKGRYLKRHGKKKQDEFWTFSENELRKVKIRNMNILILIRDEAHRFAITQHRKMRKFYMKKSLLDEIPGIGPKRRVRLVKVFGSVEKMKLASVEEINVVVKNFNLSQSIKSFLEKKLGSS